ncbi:MAG TPA: hypothetical protein VHT24_09245 [Pseudacidobacterium sp.]|jgi:hypothetical protein|nr:hypothetical protein [Pseudacidobacterium sp.]
MKRFFFPVLAVSLLVVAGCRIQVDKSKNGDKNVKIDTPMGGLHVRTDQMSAADVGLPVYPGAQLVADKNNDKSADIHMGFGKWQLRVKVIKYQTPDSQDSVLTFYRKALGRYGDVIECRNGAAVGTPTTTREGLTCSSSHSKNVHIQESEDGRSLRAGSQQHQHIVGIDKDSTGANTRFSMVELELPEGLENSGESQ